MRNVSLMEGLEFCQDYANNFFIPSNMEYGKEYYLVVGLNMVKRAVYNGAFADIEEWHPDGYYDNAHKYMRLGETRLMFTLVEDEQTLSIPLSGMPIYNKLQDVYEKKEKELELQCVNFKKVLRLCAKDNAEIMLVRERETYKLTRYKWNDKDKKAVETKIMIPTRILLDYQGLHFNGKMEFDTTSRATKMECEVCQDADKISSTDKEFLKFLADNGLTLKTALAVLNKLK